MAVMRLRLLITVFVTSLVVMPTASAVVSAPSEIARVFGLVADRTALADPAMILIDRNSGEIIYQRDAASPRRPASVMKILSATSVLEYLNPEATFATTLYLGKASNAVVISGELDPWMTSRPTVAKKDNRVWSPYLANKAIAAVHERMGRKPSSITIYYNGLFSTDVDNIRRTLRGKGIAAYIKQVDSKIIPSLAGNEVVKVNSTSIEKMLKFAILWSDNLLSERLARLASRAAGNSFDDAGVDLTFHTVLQKLEIDPTPLIVGDGSGLSEKNRISAEMIAQLLMKTRLDPKFQILYDALPVSGVSGTLADRFTKDAPAGVGLIHAKTGTLNGTVSLAGYVTAADREYIFVGIADRIPRTSLGRSRARSSFDRILSLIAAPKILSEIQFPDTKTA